MEVDDLFQIGDKVFYPMHGAGIIQAIEEKEIQGATREYCVISIPVSKMNIMVPMNKMLDLGVRSILDRETMDGILFDFHHVEPTCSLPWKERYKMNMDKMKTGDTHDATEVVRDLLIRSKEKALNASERQMLNDAREM